MQERPYLSIGEVLGLLLEEFPDVTISKIRFLESQGLIDPERTASGYRKFYDNDVDLLRVILREQRENFLPLRVIRDRLESGAIDDSDRADHAAARHPQRHRCRRARLRRRARSRPVGDRRTRPAHHSGRTARGLRHGADPGATRRSAVSAPIDRRRRRSSPRQLRRRRAVPPRRPHRTAARRARVVRSVGREGQRRLDALHRRTTWPSPRPPPASCSMGVEGRHLRAWRQAAEREASLFEQMILPLLRQRNPQARQQAVATLTTLSALGGRPALGDRPLGTAPSPRRLISG